MRHRGVPRLVRRALPVAGRYEPSGGGGCRLTKVRVEFAEALRHVGGVPAIGVSPQRRVRQGALEQLTHTWAHPLPSTVGRKSSLNRERIDDAGRVAHRLSVTSTDGALELV